MESASSSDDGGDTLGLQTRQRLLPHCRLLQSRSVTSRRSCAGFRTSPEVEWQSLELDVEGAEWFAGSLATSAEAARQNLRMASPRASRVPDVVGLDGEAAIEHPAQAGFRARLADEPTSFDRRVVRQDPPANAPVPAERIVVSLYVAT